jgi:hypothetical protein
MPLQPVNFSRRDLDLSLLWTRVQQQGGMARVSLPAAACLSATGSAALLLSGDCSCLPACCRQRLAALLLVLCCCHCLAGAQPAGLMPLLPTTWQVLTSAQHPPLPCSWRAPAPPGDVQQGVGRHGPCLWLLSQHDQRQLPHQEDLRALPGALRAGGARAG